jgi:hypothetical protein
MFNGCFRSFLIIIFVSFIGSIVMAIFFTKEVPAPPFKKPSTKEELIEALAGYWELTKIDDKKIETWLYDDYPNRYHFDTKKRKNGKRRVYRVSYFIEQVIDPLGDGWLYRWESIDKNHIDVWEGNSLGSTFGTEKDKIEFSEDGKTMTIYSNGGTFLFKMDTKSVPRKLEFTYLGRYKNGFNYSDSKTIHSWEKSE